MAHEDGKPKPHADRIEWFTVRYRTLQLAGLAVVVLGVVAWLLFGRKPPPPPTPVTVVETGARFTSIDGSVEVKRSGTLEWIPAGRAMVLRQNDLVRTRSGGVAEILFSDGTSINVRPDSLIQIEESSQDTITRQARVGIAISSGEGIFKTPAHGVTGSTTISTPTVRTTAERDTSGSIQVADSGATGVRIFSGVGRAETTSGQKIALASNQGVRVDAGGAAGATTALPTVPQLTAPSNQTEIAFPDLAQGITLLLWNAVPGVTGYRVMVDYSQTFARPLYDRQGTKATQFELRGLDKGAYYWKVAGINAAGAEGGFSEVWRFSLAQSTLPKPPLAVETLELKGNVLHVRGRTEAGASLTLNGERLDVQPDGSFNEFVTFDPAAGLTVLLRATSARGGTADQRGRVTVVN